MDYILAPSILSADFKELGKEMKKTEEGGAKYLHFDVMDGMFVPNISFGIPVLASIRGATKQVMDVHLMIREPIRYVEDFKKAGQISLPCIWKPVKTYTQRLGRSGTQDCAADCPSVRRQMWRNWRHTWRRLTWR